jgi:hypothetical protein
MATIVNARDILLQATSPRVATVTASSNIVVSQDQVEGLGLIVQGLRSVSLSASSQVFVVPNSGSVYPTSIVIAVTLKSLTATPTVTVTSGTISPAPTIVDGVITIANGDMTTDDATIKVSVTQDGTTYSDEVSIIKARESATTTVKGFLTNEYHHLPCDNLGNVINYSGASGTFKVYQGSYDITNTCTFSIPVGGNPDGLVYTLNSTTGAYSVTKGFDTGETTVTLTIRATFGATTLDKTLTLVKTLSGLAGARGSMTFYVALTGTTNTYSDTLATTTASINGGPVLNDTVTQYNNSQNFSQTKFWNGDEWVVVNAVVDGNLLVSGTVGASKISVTSLSAISANIGNITSGDIYSVTLHGGAGYPTGAYAWPTGSVNGGFHLSAAGLLIGNANSGKYFQVEASGNVYAPAFSIVNGTATFSGTLSAASGNFAGAVYGGSYTSAYAWPANGAGGGFHLSSSGLLLGNYNQWAANGSIGFLQIESSGAIASPQFNVTSAGNATFSGALSAASGTFAGTLTAGAINAVNTINLAGNAVTVPSVASSASGTASLTITPSGGTLAIFAIGKGTLSGSTAFLNIKKNGSVVDQSTVDGTGSGLAHILDFYIDTPPAGVSVTYTAELSGGISASETRIYIQEAKR